MKIVFAAYTQINKNKIKTALPCSKQLSNCFSSPVLRLSIEVELLLTQGLGSEKIPMSSTPAPSSNIVRSQSTPVMLKNGSKYALMPRSCLYAVQEKNKLRLQSSTFSSEKNCSFKHLPHKSQLQLPIIARKLKVEAI